MSTTGYGRQCPLCGVVIPPDTGHVCSKVVPYDPFPCPSCAALRASCSAKDARIRELEEEQEVSKKRILSLIHERDGYKIRAEQRFALREEVEELLGVKGTYDEEQFEKGLKELRKLVKLRNP